MFFGMNLGYGPMRLRRVFGTIPLQVPPVQGVEDIEVETLKTLESEVWYQDMKDVPSIELSERALVAAGMSLHWKADRHDKPVYVEDDKIVALYVVAYKREHGKMTTVQKGVNEESWYHQIVRNFALPRDADLSAQPSTNVGELTNLGIGPESRKKKCAPAITTVPKKVDATKAKVPKEEKKAMRKPKAEPRDTVDLPVPNPDDPIDLDSSPEPLLRAKEVKRKPESEAAAQPAKKIIRKRISKKGNLDAFATKLSPEKPIPPVHVESSSVFNDDLPPSPPRASIREQLEGSKAAEAEVEKVRRLWKRTADVGATKPKSPEVMAHGPERGKSVLEQEDPVISIPSSATTSAPPRDDAEENPAGVYQGFISHDEEDSPIRPEETVGDYYYRSYSEKRASEIHASLWKLKQGDTFSDWQIC
ncbi:hypothetical protein HanOQP8_Chr05g0177281 [Helianthus annuus]|nr:hypothetical protein HanOQP8_Chr05g0177281 [Helianthus annuus]